MITKKQEAILNRIWNNPKHSGQFVYDRWHLFSDGFKIVRLNEIIKDLEEDELIHFKTEEDFVAFKQMVSKFFDRERKIGNFEDNSVITDIVIIPSVANIKEFIKVNELKRYSPKKHIKLVSTTNMYEIYFNPFYLMDCLEVLKIGKEPATGVVYGELKPMYFKSTIGEAILLPCRPQKKDWC